VIRTVAAVSLGVAVGPAFAGDAVMWGEESRNGAVRVILGLSGREPVLVHRVAPATAQETERDFRSKPASFDASADRFAAVVVTSTIIERDIDSVAIAVTPAAVSGRFGAPVEVVSGSIPRRGDEGCSGGRSVYEHVEAVAVDGERLAIGQFEDSCTEDAGPWTDTVRVYDSGAVTTVHAGEQGGIRDVALAGRFVAWVRNAEEDEVVVHDLESGSTVLRVTQDDVAARGIDELALQDDGTVAFSLSNRSFQRLAWASPATPGVRTIARGPEFPGLALAGGRVLYERVVAPLRFTGELLLRPLAGGSPRRLASFPERRRRVGDLDLTATRATWADQPVRRGYEIRPRGPARIVVRDL
jgi:hypothetical protein